MEEENVFTCEKKTDSNMPKVTVKINDIPITMIADTGASLDIIDEVIQLKQKTDIRLSLTSTKLFT